MPIRLGKKKKKKTMFYKVTITNGNLKLNSNNIKTPFGTCL